MIKREFSVLVSHPKGGALVWSRVKVRIIDEKEYYKEIGLRGFDYKLFEEEEGGGNIKGIRWLSLFEAYYLVVAK